MCVPGHQISLSHWRLSGAAPVLQGLSIVLGAVMSGEDFQQKQAVPVQQHCVQQQDSRISCLWLLPTPLPKVVIMGPSMLPVFDQSLPIVLLH